MSHNLILAQNNAFNLAQMLMTPVTLATEAFKRALDDAGLHKGQIDGLLTMPGTTSPEGGVGAALGEIFGAAGEVPGHQLEEDAGVEVGPRLGAGMTPPRLFPWLIVAAC